MPTKAVCLSLEVGLSTERSHKMGYTVSICWNLVYLFSGMGGGEVFNGLRGVHIFSHGCV